MSTNSINRTITLEPVAHKYTDEIGRTYTSVTTLIGKFHEEFDEEYWSMYKALKKLGYEVAYEDGRKIKIRSTNKNNQFGQYVSYTIEELSRFKNDKLRETIKWFKDQWTKDNKLALKWGNKNHDSLEFGINTFYKGRTDTTYALRDSLKFNYENAFIDHYQLLSSRLSTSYPTIFKYLYDLISQGFVIFTEVLIYHPDSSYLVCGKADVVAVRGNDVIIADWKTNKMPLNKQAGYYKKKIDPYTNETIYTNDYFCTNKNMFDPIGHIPDSSYWHYALQLNMYGYLISLFGYNILKYELWHLVPLFNSGKLIDLGEGERILGTPKYYQLPKLQKEVKNLIETTKVKSVNNNLIYSPL